MDDLICLLATVRTLKGSRTGHSVKVSLWYASLLTNTRFRFLYFRIIGGLAVVAFWRSPHGPLGSGPPRAGYSQKRKSKEKGEKGKRRKKERKNEKEKKREKREEKRGKKT